MDAFAVPSSGTVLLLFGLFAAELILGFALTRWRRSVRVLRTAGWVLTGTAFLIVLPLGAIEAPGIRMLANISALFFGLKAVAAAEAGPAGRRLTPLQWLAFCLGWPGMRPEIFRKLGSRRLGGAGALLASGMFYAAAGIVLFAAAAWVWHSRHLDPGIRKFLATSLALPAISLWLHFGLVDIAAGVWRRRGADCRPLFRSPIQSRSLREFWGRRWNLAFSELAAVALYRPLARMEGPAAGILGSFAMSGLFHEAAISFPVQAGYGLPTAYFLLHGVLMLIEGLLERRGVPVESWGAGARIWTAAWLLIPLPILFHPWFLAGVVWPLLEVG